MGNTVWRENPEWDNKQLEKLKKEIRDFTPLKSVKVERANILLIGPVGAGKSSFVNTIASIFVGYMFDQAASGSAATSISTQFRKYRIPTGDSGEFLNFNLCDTQGLEEAAGIDSNFLSHLLDGNIPDKYEITSALANVLEIPGFKKETTPSDYIHCVAIVLDGSTLTGLPPKLTANIQDLQKKIRSKGIPMKIIITKIDKLCIWIKKDTSYVFKSTRLKEKVDEVSELFGLPRRNILVVRNYESETELGRYINILALLTLRELLRATKANMLDYVEDN